MEDALKKAYRAGFDASGEGYNGEYPFRDHGQNPETDTEWVAQRDKEVQEILAEQPARTLKELYSLSREVAAEQAQPYGWKVYGVSGLFVGEYAEQDARAEAKRIGGTCIAFPLYTAPPPRQPERSDYAVHLHHCNTGEYEGSCKYGDEDCPGLAHRQPEPMADEMKKQMKDRCDSMEMRGAFADGWISAEAAHGITKEST